MNATISSSSCAAHLHARPAFSIRCDRRPGCSRTQHKQACRAGTISNDQAVSVSRREAALAGLGALLLLPVGSAQAGLLGGPDKNEVYTADTSLLLEKVQSGLDLPKDASNREEVFQEIKEKTTAWVAKYRRGAAFQGRPSYNTTYSAVNALAGHFNSFGLTAPVPKKRLDRIQKEITDADRALKRGR